MKEKIRPLYTELQGYLAQAPEAKDSITNIFDASIWGHYNVAVDEAIKLTSDATYERFKIQESDLRGDQRSMIRVSLYRQKLVGLIGRLYGTYFSDESAPGTGIPGMVIQQSQQQIQSIDIKLLLNIQSKIDDQLPNFPEGSKEKTFLQKLKGSLSNIKDATQFLSLLVTTAKSLGLSLDDLHKIFS